ncbi:hypothetical protein [Erythrobacter sp. CCH5-A1]|jgi:hypothetical protein|uniref:hypothetical protein n=1 Tax=Erythrobacter sp. CCH5-A1 TaxID=1768792 RepID=UPI000AC503F3|nr:hypothetical protein [Erythrobacter sp. CCH5-A1]
MDFEAEKRELGIALEALLEKADGMKLSLVAIYISHALDTLRAEEGEMRRPPTGVQ